MSDTWYYAGGDKTIWAINPADFITKLSRVSDAQSVFVWRDGLANWVQAKNLPELAPHVIKPPPFRRAVSELTWQRAICVWWLLYWRGIIGAGIIGIVVAVIIGFIGGL